MSMSAPDTDLERLKHRHRGALIGLAAVVAFSLALFFALSFWLAEEGQTPGETSQTELSLSALTNG